MFTDLQERIGKYTVLREIGNGASAIVYLADDPFNQRQVAIKVANFEGRYTEEESARFRKLFLNEASLAGKLVHPNIVRVYDAVFDEDDRKNYIVMEYVPGGTLKKFCNERHLLPVQQLAMIVFKCCRAMDYAFQRGIVHRDLKPANILLSEDQDIKISDFGTAHISQATQTQLQGFIGSPAYMAPEMITEKQPSQQSDIYSLGVLMYEMLTGRLPFTAKTGVGVINKILHESPLPIAEVRPSAPRELIAIAERAMQKDPAKRYRTWFEMAKDLANTFHALAKLNVEISTEEKFNRLRALDFFKSFKDTDISEVLRSALWEHHAKGEKLQRAGEIGQFFYIIVDGVVEASRGSRKLSELAGGACFGEMAYLRDGKSTRTTDITSRTDVELLKIEAAQLETLSESCQLQFNKTFLRHLVERLSITDDSFHRG
jgi:eukaryotic-like serine/threonine-protein kinase